jgi:hypothetical protein
LKIEQRANKLINETSEKQGAGPRDPPRSTRMAAIADAIELMQLRGLIAQYGRPVRGRSAGDAGPALLCQCHRPLVDNAIDGGKPQTRSLSHRFGREKARRYGEAFLRPIQTRYHLSTGGERDEPSRALEGSEQ